MLHSKLAKPFVSIIIPCRNEEKFIGGVIRDMYNQDYSNEHMEVIVIDGMSEDKTKKEIQNLQKEYRSLQFFENPHKIVPYALNTGIQKSKGDVIVRVDAHCEYPENYVSYLVDNLFKLSADNVGVAAIAQSRTNTLKGLAIATSITSVFGIGDAYYRMGLNKAKEVDSVPFGCYHREVFDRIGLFDEELIRNQDDEFNSRLRKKGGKIWLLPDVEIKYYARDSIGKLAKMFYQYGLFKPLVNRKVGSAATLRQFVPPLFLLSNIAVVFCLFLNLNFGIILALLVWIPYLLLNGVFSIANAIQNARPLMAPFLSFIFIVIHLSYGYGYLKGWIKFQLLKKSVGVKDISTNR